jgi:hypothetical protein
MPTKRIKRYSPELHLSRHDLNSPTVKMGESSQGMYVLHADYAKLEERVLALQDHCPHTYGRLYPGNECALCGKVV